MIRYFEYAVSQGEGTLVCHAVVAWQKGSFFPSLRLHECAICETITKERYAEFITIHGSEVAV